MLGSLVHLGCGCWVMWHGRVVGAFFDVVVIG